jgi:ketol-acid reductoisomerase
MPVFTWLPALNRWCCGMYAGFFSDGCLRTLYTENEYTSNMAFFTSNIPLILLVKLLVEHGITGRKYFSNSPAHIFDAYFLMKPVVLSEITGQ